MFNNSNEWDPTVVTPRAPNVLFARSVLAVPPDNVCEHVKGTVLDIALQAAKQRPAWTFYITRAGQSDKSVSAYIYCGEERLGVLSMELYYPLEGRSPDYRPYIECPGIARNMSRKNGMASANPKRILKAILDNCRETPVHELVAAKMLTALRELRSIVHTRRTYTVDKDLDPSVVYGFLEERGLWEDFASKAVAAGATPGFAANMKGKVDDKRVAQDFVAASVANKLYLAMPKDQDYYVSPVASMTMNTYACGPTTLYTQDKHSDEFKTAVGLLKIAPEGFFVEGVGVKRVIDNAAHYFVVLQGGVQG